MHHHNLAPLRILSLPSISATYHTLEPIHSDRNDANMSNPSGGTPAGDETSPNEEKTEWNKSSSRFERYVSNVIRRHHTEAGPESESLFAFFVRFLADLFTSGLLLRLLTRFFFLYLFLVEYSKRYSEYFDPCQDAANRSLKCLRRNGGDRMMCQDYFELVSLFLCLSIQPHVSHFLYYNYYCARLIPK